MANVLSADEARVLVTTSLGDDALNGLIGREEKWLARRVGQLTGERVQHLRPRIYADDTRLWLQRPTDAVQVADSGVDLDPDTEFALVEAGTAIERLQGWWAAAGSWPLAFVDATYTPNDEEEVKRVLIGLLRLTLTETGMKSETIGAYSYSRDNATPSGQREALARELLPRRGPGSIQLRGGRVASGMSWLA